MDDMTQSDAVVSKGTANRRSEALRGKSNLFLGIDIGSTSSDVVLLDEKGSVIYSNYERTRGKPIDTARGQLGRVLEKVNPKNISLTAATGSAGRLVAKLLGIEFVNEVPAQAAAIYHLYPDLDEATIVEMGGQDSKLVFLSSENGKGGRVRDFALNTVCAAGTGSFLDQQAQRLGVEIEGEFGELAVQSKSVPRMAGRCSVFAKSDMIHLQQQATPVCDIIAGLCRALAMNLKSNLGCGRDFVKPIIFTGGVAANVGVVKALEYVFQLPEGGLVVPEQHFFTGAIGAVLVAKTRAPKDDGKLDLGKIDAYLKERGTVLQGAPRRQSLDKPLHDPPKSPVYSDLVEKATEPIEAYIGVDVGSLSTNVVVMDVHKRILAKEYLWTAGRPLEAVRQGLDIVGKRVAGKVKIMGAATTGSGRYLTGDFIGADTVINEITAQAAGAAIVNPEVDTIFEIGGQDSKYISLENGVVVDFEMNHACAAGTGSFLEEQAERLGISIKGEFAEKAYASKAPLKLGERCTVFMESDLLSYQQQGAETEDMVAGLAYSIVANYLNRVVGRRKIGDRICFQGGTAFNHAVWAAFEKVVGKPIQVPDHHEVTGALGAAAIAAEHMKRLAEEEGRTQQSSFKGFENLVSIEYTVESFTCEHCANNCEIKKVQLPDSDPLYYGCRCDRYNLKKTDKKARGFDAFRFRSDLLKKCAGLSGDDVPTVTRDKKVGIPMMLLYWQYLPLFGRFLKELGFEVVLSGRTDKKLIAEGVESVTAQPCFPVKVGYGHIARLIKQGVDYIFLPSVVSAALEYEGNEHNQLCPYIQSIPYQADISFAEKLAKTRTKIITAPIRLGESEKVVAKTFVDLSAKLGVPPREARAALRQAEAAQQRFERAMLAKGREILDGLRPEDKLFILVSRPYNGCDNGVNLELPRKLADLGVQIIPMDMLDLSEPVLTDPQLHSNVYWKYGQKILRAGELIRRDPRLFAIYLSNFSCGPDSFLQTFFKDIMGSKPCLQLELDEHSADAGVITRLEAFFESLKNYRRGSAEADAPPEPRDQRTSPIEKDRTLYVPYMGDNSYGLAACFRSFGQPAQVMPVADEAALIRGRQFTTGKECLPCAITTGEMLSVIDQTDDAGEKVAFFMPAAQGPCRFGMYNCLQKLIMKYNDLEDVPIIAPSQDSTFYHQLGKSVGNCTAGTFKKHAWLSVIAIDLLRKLILRVRPMAVDSAVAQQVYDRSLARWLEGVEKRFTIPEAVQMMESIAAEFEAIELLSGVKKPKIGIVGEIYVRSHEFSNKNLVARFEELGAVCEVASLAEWVYYTNYTRAQMARRRGQWKYWVGNIVQDMVQRRIEKKLAAPLEKSFGPLAEPPLQECLDLGRKYVDDSFEGEAILTIGKTIEYHHQGFGGVVNAMPFTCMPSTVVSSMTRKISADCGDMPILSLSFDGQDDATLPTRLEAFVEQVRQSQKPITAGVR